MRLCLWEVQCQDATKALDLQMGEFIQELKLADREMVSCSSS